MAWLLAERTEMVCYRLGKPHDSRLLPKDHESESEKIKTIVQGNGIHWRVWARA